MRITYSGVASTAALVIALSAGGAYAANLIGTKQLAKGAVTTAKIHKGAVTTAKIKNGAVGPAKIKNGSVGATKLDAATNAAIVPPWGTIPSGKTVVGEITFDGFSGTSTDRVKASINLPANAPVPLDTAHISFGTTFPGGKLADPTHCSGTPENPTAEPGYFCLYNFAAVGYNNTTAAASLLGGKAHTVNLILFEASASADNYYDVTWAYTAP